MTPADLARQNAISFECKKDTLRQNQSGDWKIAFTVQGLDMDERLTKAFPGTRYQAVLVEINDDETPVHQPAKLTIETVREIMADKPAGAKREPRKWDEIPLTEQAGMRSQQPIFYAFLREEYGFDVETRDQAAIVIRQLCKVESRKEFETDPLAKARWEGLDDQFLAWKLTDA